MNISSTNLTFRLPIVFLILAPLINFPANAATVELDGDIQKKQDSIFNSFSYDDMVEPMFNQPQDNVKSNYNTVLELIKKKEYKQAKAKVNTLIKDNPNQPIYYNLKALLELQEKNLDLSEQNYKQAIKLDPKNTQAYMGLMVLALEEKQFDIAKQYANKALELDPNNIAALSFLARASLANQDLAAAEKILRQIINQEPKDVKHRVILARLLSNQTNKEAEVLELLDQATLNSNPPTPVLALKTTFLIKQKKYQQAYTIAKKIDEDNPELSIGKILKGDVFFTEKKLEKALSSYQQAYQIKANTKVLDIILKIFTIENKQQEAIRFLEKELAKNQDNVILQFRLATLYQHLGQYESAAKYYEVLLKKQKDNTFILNNLAWIYSQINNPKALELAEKAFKNAPKSGIIADTYGYILLKNGNKKQSLEVLKQAVAMMPNEGIIQLHLAEAYIANQNTSQAQAILQKLIDKDGVNKTEAIKLMKHL